MTATTITIDHYHDPIVKSTILKMCRQLGGARALNGDDGWYVHKGDYVRLRGLDDYENTVSRARSLYMTADVFQQDVFGEQEPWEKGRGNEGKPANPIGTRADLVGYTLFADIDATKDPDDQGDEAGKPRSKIYHEGRKEALEAAAAFMVDYLKERGISGPIRVAFSGQGVYVFLHPGLSGRPEHNVDGEYRAWLMAFNALLADIEKAFFKAQPKHTGRVKFDKLNNVKRKVKCILSIHRTQPFAVSPLDRDNPKIDFEAARLSPTLPTETIEDAQT